MAREVGTEGKLGGQAQVKGVSGTWRDLTDNVNFMASNLTSQVRNIAQVTTAVAQGDLSQKITVDAQGEILELKSTVNTMVDQLSAVRRRGHPRRPRGRHRGQARRPGRGRRRLRHLAGPDRERQPARRQPDHPGARDRRGVHRRDPRRPDPVDHRRGAGRGRRAQGQHQPDDRQPARRPPRSTRSRTGCKSNLARIGGRLQGQRDLQAVTQMIMSEVTPVVQAQQGAFFLADSPDRADRACGWLRRYGAESTADDRVFHARRGPGRPGRGGEEAAPRPRRADRPTCTVRAGLGVRLAGRPVRAAGAVRGAGARRHRARRRSAASARCTPASSSSSSRRSASCSTRSSPTPAPRSCSTQSQRLAQELQVQSVELQRTNAELEDKARLLTAAVPRPRDQEPRDRDGPPRPGGEGRAAGAVVAVQVASSSPT